MRRPALSLLNACAWEEKVSAASFLLDGEGKISGRDLHGDELKEAVAKTLTDS